MGNAMDYLSSVGKNRTNPRDAFTHGKYLLENEEDLFKDADQTTRFSRLLSKMVLLANISDDHLMRYYQNDIIILIMAYDAARREKTFRPVFNVMYHGWVAELSMTRTRKGMERWLQALLGAAFQPPQDFGGYGDDFAFGEEPQQGGIGGLISKILPKKGSYGNNMREQYGR